MATSSALKTSNEYIKYQITVTEGTPDVAGNSSPVTVSVRFYRTNTGYKTWGSGTVYCKINGTTYSAAVTSEQYITNSGIVLFTKSLNITHSDDGSKVLSVSAWISHSQFSSEEQSFNVTLTTIARASQPSCLTWPNHTKNVGNFGSTISIHMNRMSTSFTHTVRYSYGTLTDTIGTNVKDGLTWTIPLSFMDLIPNNTSGQGTIYVDTYSGSKLIGTKSCIFIATVPTSVKPTCSLQVLDATDTKDKYGNLVQGLSKLYVKVTAAGAYSSTIKSYAVNANQTSYDRAEITTDELTGSGTTTVTAQVTDSRGRISTAASASFPVLAYVKPNISALSVHRCDQNGNEDDQGEYVQVTFSATITPLNNKNSAAYKLHYKKSTDDTFTIVDLPELAGDYQVTDYSYILAADSDFSYDIEIEATDDLGPVTRATSASTGFTFMDWSDSGKSIAFGKVAELEEGMEVALPLKVMDGLLPINIEKDTDLNSIKKSGWYRCGLSSDAASLLNCPTDKAFVLEVLPNVPATQRLTEYIEHASPRIFIRNYYDYADAWGDWYELVPLQNRLASKVSLISMAATETYTFPSDGYLVLRAHYSTGAYVNCTVAGANGVGFIMTATSGASANLKGNPTDALYVRRGMTLSAVGTSSTSQNALDFYPLY